MDEKERLDKMAEILGKLGVQLVEIMENNNMLLKENLALWERNKKLTEDLLKEKSDKYLHDLMQDGDHGKKRD